jgi:hypothetical protein
VTVGAAELPAFIQALWDQTVDISIYVETVHRLSNLGVVVTHTARGVSHDDFDAKWRMVDLFTVEGDRINRLKLFDEADLGAALARFEEIVVDDD